MNKSPHPQRTYLWQCIFYCLILLQLIFTQSVQATSPTQALGEWQIKGALAGLADEVPEVQIYALEKLNELNALDKISESYIPRIISLLEYKNWDNFPYPSPYFYPQVQNDQNIAAKALGVLDKPVKPYIPNIINLLTHKDSYVRAVAVQALTELDADMIQEYVPDIIALLTHPNNDVRISATQTLGNLEKITEQNISQILTLWRNKKNLTSSIIPTSFHKNVNSILHLNYDKANFEISFS